MIHFLVVMIRAIETIGVLTKSEYTLLWHFISLQIFLVLQSSRFFFLSFFFHINIWLSDNHLLLQLVTAHNEAFLPRGHVIVPKMASRGLVPQLWT